MLYTDLFTEEEPSETEESPQISYGKQLAEARVSAGMSQVQLADKVGFSRGHIALIEQGRGRPEESLSRILSELFGDSLELFTASISEDNIKVEKDDGS